VAPASARAGGCLFLLAILSRRGILAAVSARAAWQTHRNASTVVRTVTTPGQTVSSDRDDQPTTAPPPAGGASGAA